MPNTLLTTSGLTDKDIEDVKFAVAEGVDYIARSFVQSADDVIRLREIAEDKVKIIAKIEMALALKNLDAIMVGRKISSARRHGTARALLPPRKCSL